MGFPTALAASETDYLATMQLASDAYLLTWGQNIIFTARVNQSSFDSSFATINYDTVGIGAFTDVLEGYTVWLSPTNDIRNAVRNGWWGRLRTNATATVLDVEWNSFIPSDNDFIFVTKDLRESTKTPFLSGSTWRMDFAISYHHPPPIIYNVPTWFFDLIEVDGTVDITIEPAAYAIADGATISSWALTSTDGGSQVSFDGGTGKAVIRFSEPGDYMPRITVTDSNGTTQFFTPYVKIAPVDLSSVIKVRFEDFSIAADTDSGWNMSMEFWDGVADVLDGTMCAVYMPHKTSGNRVLFCGRSRTEVADYTADGSGSATFNVDGLASIMNNINAVSWRYKDVASPDDFAEIKNVTPWRAIATYIRELTNINNTHSLELADITDDYRYISYFFQKGTMLDSLRAQMWSINLDFDFSSDGMFKLVRNLRYEDEADRVNLTNVINFEFKHYSGDERDEIMYSLERAHSKQVGKATAGCGWYNTTSKKVNFFAALTPVVQLARGTEQVVTDRQILKANLSQADAETEGNRRATNDFAAKQSLDTLNDIRLSGGFIGKMNPSVSDWYSHLITVFDGIRRITYSAAERWLCTGLTLSYDVEAGMPMIFPVFQIESDDLGFAGSIRNPLPLTFIDNPIMMPNAAFPTFDYDPSIDFPTGVQEGDEQPITQEDTNPVVGAQDPATMSVLNNSTLVCWSETRSQMTREFGQPAPAWFEIAPGALPSGYKIQMFAWNRAEDGGTGGYLIAHNDTILDPDTRVYYRRNVGSMEGWQETVLTDMLATMVNVTAKSAVIVYGRASEFISGDWRLDYLVASIDGGPANNGNDAGGVSLIPSSESGTHVDPVSNALGVYNEVEDWFEDNGLVADGGGKACNIEWPIPAGVTITKVKARVAIIRGTGSGGEKNASIGIDGTNYVTKPWLSLPNRQSDTMNTGDIEVAEATKIVIHNSKDRGAGDGYARIEGVFVEGGGLTGIGVTRWSDDSGLNFEGGKSVGDLTLGDGSFTRRKGGAVLAAKDENVKKSPLAGEAFLFNADQGGNAVGAGRIATALLKFGKDDDYLVALDATIGLQKVVNDVLTDITPNDGANDGFAVGPGALAMTSIDDDFIWFLGNFGGSVKLAYSTDLGTSWNFNSDPTSNATWVTANPRSSKMIYISDGSNILQSLDGGATLTVHASPIPNLTGVSAL